MDLSKSFEFFDPTKVNGKCHIIGCGSVGSTIAEGLARMGITKFVLYDFDEVEPHNIVNQMFVNSDIGAKKVDATKRIITEINPDAQTTIEIEPDGYKGQSLSGYVFLCVDSIELRKWICEKNRMNHSIKAMFDCRTRLTDAQTYAAEWGNIKQVKNFIASMDFTHEEAAEATPTTACGTVLGVAPTVRVISALCICNFVNYILGKGLKPIIVCDPFAADIY